MATGLYKNACRLPVFIQLGGQFFPPAVIPSRYLMGTHWVSQEKKGAQFLCNGIKPTDESFTEIWDFLGSRLRVPYFSVTLLLGLYPTPKDISIPTLLGQVLLVTTLRGPFAEHKV
jgi:hypothetical protein